MDPIRERIQASFDKQSFMQHIGADLIRVEKGLVELWVRRDERLLQQHGFLHAGAITSALDSACGYAALTVMDDDAAVLSVEFKVNFLAPAAGDLFVIRGNVLKAGKTVVVCRGDAFSVDGGAERLIAAMQATMMTVRGRDLKD